jgi:hypothetical protein
MSDPIAVVAMASLCIAFVAWQKYRTPVTPYFHRRVMQDGEVTHVREGSGENPQVVMDMIMTGRYTFPKGGNDDEAEVG